MINPPIRPTGLNLANWRKPPYCEWAFHHVREVIPSELIPASEIGSRLASKKSVDISALPVAREDGSEWSFADWLSASTTDALLVAHRGELVEEWYSASDIESNPHIVFSVSKSITSMLAGVFVEQGILDPARQLSEYIPELNASGYRGASLQNLLDMAIAIDFVEDYEAISGKFVEYRSATAWHPCALEEIDSNLHDFIASLGASGATHGQVFDYKSPNSDLLGWVLERVTGKSLATLLSDYLWQPMGAEADAYITVDRKGGSRSAGGICVLPRDLLRFGELVRNQGAANDTQVISADWVQECCERGDAGLWARYANNQRFPQGKYHNKWYQTGNPHAAVVAIGIHSQWIYIDSVAEVTIVKLSAQASPLDDRLSTINLRHFAAICDAL